MKIVGDTHRQQPARVVGPAAEHETYLTLLLPMAHPRDLTGNQVHDAHLLRGLCVAHEGAPAGSLACVTLISDVVRHPGQPHLFRFLREIERHAQAVRRDVEAADPLLVLNVEHLGRVHFRRVGRRRPATRTPGRVLLENPEQLALLVTQKAALSLGRLFLVGRPAVPDVGELRHRPAERLYLEQIIVTNEVDAGSITGNLNRGQPSRERGEEPFPARANLQQVEVALVVVGAPRPVLGEHRREPRLHPLCLFFGHPLRPSAATTHPVESFVLLVRLLPDEVERLAVVRPAEP